MGIASLLAGILSIVGLFLSLLIGTDAIIGVSLLASIAGILFGLTAIVRSRQRIMAISGIVCSSLIAVVDAILLGIGHGIH